MEWLVTIRTKGHGGSSYVQTVSVEAANKTEARQAVKELYWRAHPKVLAIEAAITNPLTAAKAEPVKPDKAPRILNEDEWDR